MSSGLSFSFKTSDPIVCITQFPHACYTSNAYHYPQFHNHNTPPRNMNYEFSLYVLFSTPLLQTFSNSHIFSSALCKEKISLYFLPLGQCFTNFLAPKFPHKVSIFLRTPSPNVSHLAHPEIVTHSNI